MDKIRNATLLFAAVYGSFRFHRLVLSPILPQFNRHLFIGEKRMHHYESGLYLASAGLALFLEDICDWNKD